jgi:hypothetical protein
MVRNLKTSPTEVPWAPDTALLSSYELRKGTAKAPLKYRREIVWPLVIAHGYLNLAALYGVYLMLTSAKVLTGVWGMYMRSFRTGR